MDRKGSLLRTVSFSWLASTSLLLAACSKPEKQAAPEKSVESVSTQLGPKGVVSASSLRLRQAPDSTAQVISGLNQNDLIAIIAKSSFTTTIEGKTAHWYKVVNSSGTVGWAFGGFISDSPIENVYARYHVHDISTLESGIISAIPQRLQRSSGTLTILLANGKRVKYEDRPAGQYSTDAGTKYTLTDYFPDIDHFLVQILGYESVSYDLIDGKSGDVLLLGGVPHFSPSRGNLVELSCAYEQCSSIAFHDLSNPKNTLIKQYLGDGSASMFWLSDASFIIGESTDPHSKNTGGPVLIQHGKDGWVETQLQP